MTLAELLATAEYAGLSDSDAAALANESRHAITVDATHTYRSLAASSGIGIDPTRRLIQSMQAAGTADVLIAKMDDVLNGEVGLNANDASTQAVLDSLAANVDLPLTLADAALIKALANSTESDAERFGLGFVGEQHVTRIRFDQGQ